MNGPALLTPGEVVAGRYRVAELLGAGGMGAVYRAEHVELGKVVALKVMLGAAAGSDQALARFINEARAAARIGHPGIVEVFDLGTEEGRAYIAMELLAGEELEERIERVGPLPLADVVRFGCEIADALSAAHGHGIVHRDLKPANVFLATRGRQHDIVKILDFGVAKLVEDASDVKTKTGSVLGTPLYMAPEQLQDSKQVDARADVYAIGGLLYAMLTGRPPLDGNTLHELFFRIVTVAPPPPSASRPEVPRWLDSLVCRALAKRPEDRPVSAAEVLTALEAGGAGESYSRPVAPPGVRVAAGSAPVGASDSVDAIKGSSLSALSSMTPPPQGVRSLALPVTGLVVFVGIAGTVGLLALRSGSAPGAESHPAVSAQDSVEAQPEPGVVVVPVPASDVALQASDAGAEAASSAQSASTPVPDVVRSPPKATPVAPRPKPPPASLDNAPTLVPR